MLREHGRLIGAKGIDRLEDIIEISVEEDRRALALEIPEIGAVLNIADQFREFAREAARDMGWIGQPLVFIRLEPTKAVADDDAAANGGALISAGSVERRAEKDDRIAGLGFGDNPRPRSRISHRSRSVAAGPDQRRPVFLGK